MTSGHTIHIFVENSHKRSFSIISKANTYGFFTKKWSSLKSRMWSMARKHMWGEAYEPLVDDQWPHTPIFVENSHERPFSIISKANNYGFLTKKWSPPEIQECDLWQGNICGVSCTSLWSMISGHTTPIFVENRHERPFSILPMANTNGLLTKKSKNVIYGKETYVGCGV
jgi:hypothetical protein